MVEYISCKSSPVSTTILHLNIIREPFFYANGMIGPPCMMGPPPPHCAAGSNAGPLQ